MSEPSTSEALRSLGGDQAQAGWQSLVERHGPDVWRLILSRSRDANEAEDVYQDFWMGLPRSAASFKPSGDDQERSARAWLMRVAYTTAIDRVRRRRPATIDAKGATMDSQSATARLVAQDHIRPGTEDLHDREFLVARVQGALKDLPENYRRPLLLYVVGGLSYEELAADLRCTVNNARVRVHRGLKRLREILGGDARLNERALAGLILPVMFTMPPVPTLTAALSSGTVGVGASVSAGSSAVSGGMTVGTTGMAVGATGVVAAGLGLTAVLASAPVPEVPLAPPVATPVVRMLDDFERSDVRITGTSHLGTAPEISLAPAPAGGGSGSALRFGWTTEHKGWIDCAYRHGERQVLTDVSATAATVATMQLWAPQTTRLNHVAIRFMDADGEIFEWRHALPDQGLTGWRTVEFPLDPMTSSTWDKRPIANRIVEMPMSLLGYAIEIGNGSKEGVVIIDEVKVRTH